MKILNLLSIIAVLVCFLLSVGVYNIMPEKIASHWDVQGDVNDYMNKFWGLFLLPVITLILYGILKSIIIIDPLKKNIEKFRDSYDGFILVLVLYMLYIHLIIILWNLGYKFDINKTLMVAFVILFFYIGVLLEKTKRNWFIGIRTPWTMSDDRVWDKTHKAAGKWIKYSSPLFLLVFIESNLLFAVIFVEVGIILAAVIYSYLIYKKIKK